MAKSLFLYRKTVFLSRTICPKIKNRKYGTDNQCNIITNGYRSLDIRTILEKKCGKVLCQYAAAYDEREDREKPLRQAIIAGNPHAPLLYALTCPELFDKVRPLRLFSFGSIRCVFAGYYFPNALKAGFVMTSWHSCKKYMISRMEKTAVRNIFTSIPASFH